jgi:hypothetical protein
MKLDRTSRKKVEQSAAIKSQRIKPRGSLTSPIGGSIFAKAANFPKRERLPAIQNHHGIMDTDLSLDPDHWHTARLQIPPAAR